MAARLSLPTLLSAALVAFTVEFDNESEHRMPHRTTDHGRSVALGDGPFLVSQVMWSNVMQYVTEAGIRVGDLHARARTTRDSLGGLTRWGYVVVDRDPDDGRASPPGDDLVVRATSAGRVAQVCWRPIAGEIEGRWRQRIGGERTDDLRRALASVVVRPDELPDYLPIVHPTQNGRAEIWDAGASAPTPGDRDRDLSVLLSQALLAFTIDFERQSRISLTISANTLRVLDGEGIRVRDLPPRTGVSKEGNAMAVGFLVRHGCAVVAPDPGASRGKVIKLTDKGQRAQRKYHRLLGVTEQQWEHRLGPGRVRALRESLEPVVGDRPTAAHSPLYRGLTPYPEGWRASVGTPETLPHHPMVLHRGGYPDGS